MTVHELIIQNYLEFPILTLDIKNHCSSVLQLAKCLPDSYLI